MNMDKLLDKYTDYIKAVVRLKEVLETDTSNTLIYDAAIQRFEFTYELGWKLIKRYMEYTGIAEVNSPRSAFKEAFAAGLINRGEVWIEMIDDRNLTAHTYNEDMAIEVFNKIRDRYYTCFYDLAQRMAKEIQ